MSVVGLDIGNDTSCVALARKRGIDVIMNKESKRETPAVVNFGEWGRRKNQGARGHRHAGQAGTEDPGTLGEGCFPNIHLMMREFDMLVSQAPFCS